MSTGTSNSLEQPASGPEKALLKLALVAAWFGLALCAGMIFFEIRAKAEDWLKSPQLTLLKEKLLASPKDEQLKQQFRALDLDFRRRYFRQLYLNGTGAWLLLGATGV